MTAEKHATVCDGCLYADWKRTANLRLHPDGTGRCIYVLPDSPLPLWMHGSYYTKNATTVREALNVGSRLIFRFNSHARAQACGCRKVAA